MTSTHFRALVIPAIATRAGDQVYYIHGDHLGPTSLVTDESGNEVSRVQYSPYGTIISVTGSLPTDRLFTGQRWEAGLELYDYRARFYDPLVGSFISADTIVPEVGDPRAWNRFAYGYNNPVKFVDPSGHIPTCGLNCQILQEFPFPPPDPPPPMSEPTRPLRFVDSRLLASRLYSASASRQQAWLLVKDWFFETGNNPQHFGPTNALTHDIIFDPGMERFRRAWGKAGYPLPWRWEHTADKREGPFLDRAITGGHVFINEHIIELGLSTFGFGSATPQGRLDPVGGIIGSLDVIYVRDVGNGMVRIDIVNRMGRESGSRIPGTNSSFLPDRPRSSWGPGGTVIQHFFWYERMPNPLKMRIE